MTRPDPIDEKVPAPHPAGEEDRTGPVYLRPRPVNASSSMNQRKDPFPSSDDSGLPTSAQMK
jgi:hypothetical protein